MTAKTAQIILPDAYPQMLSRADAARAMRTLRAPETTARAAQAMESSKPALREAVLALVAGMEQAGGDMARMHEAVREIRGLAETAGLASTGRIAEILCRYLDDMVRIGQPPDAAIAALHVSAIARAARAEKDDARMGDTVAAELAALVSRKLAEARGV